MDGLLTAVRAAVDDAYALVFEGYCKGVLVPRVIQGVIAAAQRRELPIIVDPKYKNFFGCRRATIFKPNRRELEADLGAAVDLDHPHTLPQTLRRLDVEHILLTLGERRMVLISPDGEVLRVPTLAREVYDVVGAGDAITAYLAAVLAPGGSIVEAAVICELRGRDGSRQARRGYGVARGSARCIRRVRVAECNGVIAPSSSRAERESCFSRTRTADATP